MFGFFDIKPTVWIQRNQARDNPAVRPRQPPVSEEPSGYTVNLRLGWLHYLQGGYATARSHYEQAIKVAPYSIEAKLGLMLPLLAQERYEDVERFARLVLRIAPNNYLANIRLAVALRLQDKGSQAEEIVNRMLVYFPTDVSLLNEYGLLMVTKGDSARAIRIFNDVTILDPENIVAKSQLSRLKAAK